jgi:hypothetical protein
MAEKYFVIANSLTSKDLPFSEKEYLAPFPFENSKDYVWSKGLIGAAGFIESEANRIAENCVPKGQVIAMDSISKKVTKKKKWGWK